MKRGAKPEEVAWCVLFLSSDEASYVTGAETGGRRRLLGGLAYS
jgi:NAD(P)-dependent dehydrogenase (short-subunit alcohol dehydrogenase family)